MRVLGVDPGSVTTGWGLVGGTAFQPALLECGALRLGAASSFAERLHRLRTEFDALLERLEPTHAAVESPFHGVNARAALQLAHARGVVLAALGGAGIDVVEYSPATVKKAVTGEGRAEKIQVQAMVSRLLRPGTAVTDPDAADALAVALCHLASVSFRARTRGPRRRR